MDRMSRADRSNSSCASCVRPRASTSRLGRLYHRGSGIRKLFDPLLDDGADVIDGAGHGHLLLARHRAEGLSDPRAQPRLVVRFAPETNDQHTGSIGR